MQSFAFTVGIKIAGNMSVDNALQRCNCRNLFVSQNMHMGAEKKL